MNPSILDTLTPMVLNKEISLEVAATIFVSQQQEKDAIKWAYIDPPSPELRAAEIAEEMIGYGGMCLVQVIDVIR